MAQAERERSLILLADDHPTNRAVIKRQLNQLGYACESAHDGESALKLWKSGRFALLLTDLHMPRRDGYALTTAIREDEQRRGRARAPVIALSATVSTEGVERSRAAGIDDFLAKPAPLAVLATTLQRYLPLQRFASNAASNPAVASNHAPARGLPDPELLADFLRSTREDLVAMHAALANGNAAAVAHEAHRIKGASRLIDASALGDCAARIEAAARAGNMNPVDSGIVELEEAVNKLAATNGC